MAQLSPFDGFWMGGFEGADHINGSGAALDMAVASGHLQQLENDHARAAAAGLRCVRESIGWRLSEGIDGAFDLRRAERIARSADRHGLQVLWTVMHYGLPGDLSLHDDALIDRFACFAAEVARVVGAGSRKPPVYTPINEIGYLAWAASQPGLLAAPNNTPDGSDDSSVVSGYAIKRRLVRAALAAVHAMRGVDPRARFLHVEPVVHVVAPVDRPDLTALAERVGSWQWQAWDLLAGHVEPSLGGSPQALDLIGVNHYHSSQWEVATEARLLWHRRDPRWRPLSALLAATWQRYGRPLVVAETGHIGAGRADWLNDMAGEVRIARAAGVPVEGLCLYPLVDRPDWNEPARWHRSGLWHVPGQAAHAAAKRADGVTSAVAAEQAGDAAGIGSGDGPNAGAGVGAVLTTGGGALGDGALSSAAADSRSAGGAGRGAGEAPWFRRTVDAPYLDALRNWQTALPHLAAGGAQRVLAVFAQHTFGRGQRRPAELASRLAGSWRVVYVEGVQVDDRGGERLDRISQGPWCDVLVPVMPRAAFDDPPARQRLLQALLQRWWKQQGLAAPVAWLCSAEARQLAESLRPRRIVYDRVADIGSGGDSSESSAAGDAALRLAAVADVVFSAERVSGGGRLQWLPDGVDVSLFSAPADGWDAEETFRLQGGLGRPRLGYAGSSLDPRIDLAWLDAIAVARPEWQVVIVGALEGIATEALPRRPNLHWLGEQPARLLPALMAGWQVGLLPSAAGRTAATGGLQPLLQMLAAGLPVVAAQQPADSALRAPLVCVAADGTAALQACAAALTEPAAQRQRRQAMATDFVGERSLDALAALAHRHLMALDAGPVPARVPPLPLVPTA